jgi:hypothetical protein
MTQEISTDPLFQKPEEETPIIEINDPINIRPDLSELGIEEHDRGVCEDSYENRAVLRRAKLNWIPVYATNGIPTGLIQAVSEEMSTQKRIMSLHEKKPILANPDNKNSDYITGLDLIAESATDYLVPPWVIGATRAWIKEQETGLTSTRRKPAALPMRCAAVKEDGIRCQLWTSGRPQDDGLCRIHLRSLKHRPGDDIERARAKLTQAAPYAVDMLEQLMDTAESEPVKLKAATEILDRAGVHAGFDLNTKIDVDVRPAASIIMERLNRLAINATDAAARLADAGVQPQGDPNIIEAEVVEDSTASAEGSGDE